MSRVMERGKARRLILTITIIVSLVFLCSLAWGGYQYTWVKVTGTVTDSYAIESLKNNRYKNTVHYTYIVDGHEYSGSFTDSNEISAKTYTKNGSIEVYYSPFLPNVSTIRPGQVLNILFQWFCCVLPFLAIINGIMYLPTPKNTPPTPPSGGFVYKAEEGRLERKE